MAEMIGEGKTEPACVPDCGKTGVPDCKGGEPDHGQEGDESGANNTVDQIENVTDKRERVGSNTFTRLSLRRKSKKLLKLPGARSLSCKDEKQIEDPEEIGKALEKLKFQVRLY